MVNTNELRKAAKAVFLAVEEDIAHDLSDKLNKAAKEIDRLKEWQPIGTAPKNGSSILAIDHDKNMGVVWWNKGQKMFEDEQCFIDNGLTHWMPLPEPPKEDYL